MADQTKIITDDVVEIQRAILGFTDGDGWVNVVVTSGGTGFTGKDVTPEVSVSQRRYSSEGKCSRVQ